MVMAGDTPEKLGLVWMRSLEMAEEAVARAGIRDRDGSRTARMAEIFYENRDEWMPLIYLAR